MSSSDLAIDFGTATVRVATRSKMVRERNSICAGRRALAGGALVDADAGVEVLRSVVRQAQGWRGFSRSRALVCAPTDASAEEKAALTECVRRAGARAVYISAEPLAAAIGAGIDVASPYTTVVVDIGEGVTDCAVIRSAQVVASRAVRVGCGKLRESIRELTRQQWALEVSEEEAERLVREVGVREAAGGELKMHGTHGGAARSVWISREELRAAFAPAKEMILQCVGTLLRHLPAPWAVEVIEDGIHLSGGGALLAGMRAEIARVARVEVRVVANPLRAVIRGAQAMLPAAVELGVWRG